MIYDKKKCYEDAYHEMKKHVGKTLTHEMIKDLHKFIKPHIDHDYRKYFNVLPVMNKMTGEVRYYSPDGATVHTDMPKLIDWCNQNFSNFNIEIAAKLHWGIVKIHPFTNGNGRLASILMFYVLLSAGYDDSICRLLKKYFEDDRKSYDDALNDGSDTYQGFKQVSSQWLEYVNNFFM